MYNGNSVEDKVTTAITTVSTTIPSDIYEIWVGTDPSASYATPYMQLKEVRLWALKRSQADIQFYRFR